MLKLLQNKGKKCPAVANEFQKGVFVHWDIKMAGGKADQTGWVATPSQCKSKSGKWHGPDLRTQAPSSLQQMEYSPSLSYCPPEGT